MSYEAKVILDSVTWRGHRLVTMQITFPRIILAEVNTHRALSRNSASSRAIPVEKRIAAVEMDPFVPDVFGKNKPGMQASEELKGSTAEVARKCWLDAAEEACAHARCLAKLDVHKQLANRLLEPFSWHTAVVSSTEWSNHDALRDHKDAAPQYQLIARPMREAREQSTPVRLGGSEWHLPYVAYPDGSLPREDTAIAQDIAGKLGLASMDVLRMMSTGRCAAVSFNRQETTDGEKAVSIYQRLKASGHLSPFEHPARPMTQFEYEELFNQPQLEWTGEGTLDGWKEVGRTHFCGNFQGWIQDRKFIANEHDFSLVQKES